MALVCVCARDVCVYIYICVCVTPNDDLDICFEPRMMLPDPHGSQAPTLLTPSIG